MFGGMVTAFYCHGAMAGYKLQTITVSGGIFDMVYDSARHLLYMTTGGAKILRYDMSTKAFLSPISVLGNLQGMDISADGSKFAVADAEVVNGNIFVDIIDLTTDKVTRITTAAQNDAAGTFDAAFSGSSYVVASGALPPGYSGAGVPSYVADLSSGTLTQISGENALYMTEDTIVRASSDHAVVAYTAGDISNGPWAIINVKKATLAAFNQTNTFNTDVAVAPKGRYDAILASSAYVFNHAGYAKQTFTPPSGDSYTGAVFDTKRPAILYLSLSGTDVDMVSVSTGKVLHTIKTGLSTSSGYYNGGFGPGSLRIASDNTYLFENSGTGVVAVKLP
jgi:hypothetical protein